MAPVLHVRLLGVFALAYAGQSVTGVPSPCLQGMLACLLLCITAAPSLADQVLEFQAPFSAPRCGEQRRSLAPAAGCWEAGSQRGQCACIVWWLRAVARSGRIGLERGAKRTVYKEGVMAGEPAADKYVKVDGVKTRYWSLGDQGNPVVLIHGIGGFVENWGPNVAALAQRHRVYALDLVGFGRSDKPVVGLLSALLCPLCPGLYG